MTDIPRFSGIARGPGAIGADGRRHHCVYNLDRRDLILLSFLDRHWFGVERLLNPIQDHGEEGR